MRGAGSLLLVATACLLLCGSAHGSETSDAFAAERKALAAASLRAKAQAIKAQELKQKGAARLQKAATDWDDTDDEGNDDDVMAYVRGDPPAMSPEQVGVVDYHGSDETKTFSPLKWFYGHLANAIGAVPHASEGNHQPGRAHAASWDQAAAPHESSWEQRGAPVKSSWDEPMTPGKAAFQRSEVAVRTARGAAQRAKAGDSTRGAAFSAGFLQGVVATGAKSEKQQEAMAMQLQKQGVLVGELEDVVHSLEEERRARNFEKTRVAGAVAHDKAAEDAEQVHAGDPALSQANWAHKFGDHGIFPAPKLTDLFRNARLSAES
jgi:hypothetical protein